MPLVAAVELGKTELHLPLFAGGESFYKLPHPIVPVVAVGVFGQRRNGLQRPGFLDNALKISKPFGRLAVKFAALRPPQDFVLAVEGLAVRCITADRGDAPRAIHKFEGRQIPPSERKIAFIAEFIDDDGDAILLLPGSDPSHLAALDGGMRQPFLLGEGADPIMHADEMMISVLFRDKAPDRIPIVQGERRHHFVLVGKAPPHIAVSGKAGDGIPQILQVFLHPEPRKAPAVIGVKEDDVRLDVHLPKRQKAAVEPIPIAEVGLFHIPLPLLVLFEGEVGRLVVVIGHMLGEDAHADLVEGRRLERENRLFHERVLLARPGIASRAEGIEGRAVLIAKMRSLRLHAPVHALIGDAFQAPLFFPDAVAPLAQSIGHEAHGVLALCLQKALRPHTLFAQSELCAKRRIADGKFYHVILFYGHSETPHDFFSIVN